MCQKQPLSNNQLSGEDAEYQNVIQILTAGDSSEAQRMTTTACYVPGGISPQSIPCPLVPFVR